MQAGVCYWKDGVFWIGLLEDYPGYRTQGRTFQELKKNHAYPVIRFPLKPWVLRTHLFMGGCTWVRLVGKWGK